MYGGQSPTDQGQDLGLSISEGVRNSLQYVRPGTTPGSSSDLSPFSCSDIHLTREGSAHTGDTLDRLMVLVPVRVGPDEDRVNAHRPETHHLADHTPRYSGGFELQGADRTSVTTSTARCVDRDFEKADEGIREVP